MTQKKLTTLLEIINYSSEQLAKKNIKNPRLNIELMFCEILNCDRMKLYLDFDKPLKQEEISEFKIMFKRRLSFEPLQYILGKTNFYGYTINLNNKVLIPRIETEILVEKILEDIYKSNKKNVNIKEIGTGSGCISIALSGEMTKKNINHNIVATDISEESLDVARKNARLNKIEESNILFKYEDFLNHFTNEEQYDYIVSNPPYIPLNEIDKLDLEVKDYEPISALTDGKNGLSFYEKIFNLYSNEYQGAKIFIEIGDGKREKIEDLLIKSKISNYIFLKDYCNIYRVLKIY